MSLRWSTGQAAALLGRHVRGRADHARRSRSAPSRRVAACAELGDAEVEHLDEVGDRASRRHEEDVVGLEIAVDDAARVRGAERAADCAAMCSAPRDRRAARVAATLASVSPSSSSMTMYDAPSASSPKSMISTMCSGCWICVRPRAPR